ncbi:hypothetical protein LQ939_18780 [Pantoea alhagi]|uniref:hypothetical protein n=1 Tax=Pantoea alhagi TaxID=1891675 RepID=UPI00202B1C48|nr:hypothetical protein [Pantoea alhagi]URQ60657.1 hypothetical protein LQ939_18780 [Pantoea alhagi]
MKIIRGCYCFGAKEIMWLDILPGGYMRELTLQEMHFVSGSSIADNPANLFNFVGDRLASSIFGCVAAAITGGSIGYLHGGDAMGVLGLSIIGQLTGGVTAAVIGGVGGLIGGLLVPFDWSYPLALKAINTVIGGKV